MHRFFSLLIAVAILLFCTRQAFADAPDAAVLVVDITGDIDDAEALRTAIGNELHATAVSPDDARARSARGTLTIDARGGDGRLSATYRSMGTPVTRTVDLPSDPKRARSVAVLLAGNVAREEASEILNGLEKPAPSSPSVAVERREANDDEELARLRAILGELGASARDRRKWVGIASIVEGTLSVGAGVYYLTKEGERFEYTRRAGLYLVIHGAISGGIGALLLSGPNDVYEQMEVELETSAKATSPADAVKSVEAKWAEHAATARTTRKVAGWIGIVAGTFGAGVGLALPALVPPSQQDAAVPAVAVSLVALSGALVAIGVDSLFTPSSIEQTWQTYRAMKGTSAPIRPTAGVSPLPGGGGVATLGFTF